MSASTFADLRQHAGHQIEVVVYGDPSNPVNVATECTDCSEVLQTFDAHDTDSPDPTAPTAPAVSGGVRECGDDHYLALWFTPDAVRDHYDGDDTKTALLATLTDEYLAQAAENAVSADSLYREFHEQCEFILEDAQALRDAPAQPAA